MNKKIKAALLAAILTLNLASCSLLDQLGFDTYDYMSEEITGYVTDEETEAVIAGLLDIVVTDSLDLDTFSDMSDAIKLYSDAVLTYMLETEYAKYSGNTALLEKAEKNYPELSVTQLIPENDFESMMYRCFGGNVKINHHDTNRFRYLPKVSAYTSVASFVPTGYNPLIKEIAETDRTYRVRFTVTDGENESKEYFALIIRRDDGTHYFKKLLDE